MSAVECPHGMPDGAALRDDGRPACPLCRREQRLRDRHAGHPHWDPQSAAANDLPEEEP